MRLRQSKQMIFDLVFSQKLRKELPGSISSFGPKKTHTAAKRGKVGRHIGRPAQTVGLVLDFHDRNGSFGRYPTYPAPQVAIQHYIAYYQCGNLFKTAKFGGHHLILHSAWKSELKYRFLMALIFTAQ